MNRQNKRKTTANLCVKKPFVRVINVRLCKRAELRRVLAEFERKCVIYHLDVFCIVRSRSHLEKVLIQKEKKKHDHLGMLRMGICCVVLNCFRRKLKTVLFRVFLCVFFLARTIPSE